MDEIIVFFLNSFLYNAICIVLIVWYEFIYRNADVLWNWLVYAHIVQMYVHNNWCFCCQYFWHISVIYFAICFSSFHNFYMHTYNAGVMRFYFIFFLTILSTVSCKFNHMKHGDCRLIHFFILRLKVLRVLHVFFFSFHLGADFYMKDIYYLMHCQQCLQCYQCLQCAHCLQANILLGSEPVFLIQAAGPTEMWPAGPTEMWPAGLTETWPAGPTEMWPVGP